MRLRISYQEKNLISFLTWLIKLLTQRLKLISRNFYVFARLDLLSLHLRILF